MIRLRAEFSAAFRSEFGNDCVNSFSDRVCQSFGGDAVIERCESDYCFFSVRSNGLSKNEFLGRIRDIMNEQFSRVPSEKEIRLTVFETETDLFSLLLTPSGERGKDESIHSSVPARIDELIGADQFKELVAEIAAIAPAIAAHHTYTAFTFRSYLFSINDGCGYSTCLSLFADLIEQCGLFRFQENRRVVEEKLLPPSSDRMDPFSPVTDFLRRYGKDGGILLSIDISEWIPEIDEPKFRRFLSFLEDYSARNIFVFRVPFLEREVLQDLNAALKDILYMRAVSFPPMGLDQLCECAERILAQYGFSASEDAKEILAARILEEKSDGRFYGINTVNKIVCEMIYRKHLHDSLIGRDNSLICAEDIEGLAAMYRPTAGGMDELNGMIGMESVRATVEEIVSQIEFSLSRNRERPCIHMRFVGNPGTGKTTVARILGKVLKERGVLRNGHFFEYSGRDFCGRYVGETAPKTTAMCRDAYGSVLFIDEAYALYRGDDEGHDFGREALDTLLAEMENHRTDLIVIMAGYPDEMDTLIQSNPGLESRMPYLIEFPNYTREQLTEIFFKMVGNTFSYDAEFRNEVSEFFSALPDDVLNAKNFSNARFVRNLYERTCAKASTRSQFDGETQRLTKDDFRMAGKESVFRTLVEKKKRSKIGF